jgi:uncharacterized protein (DUF1501 family)
MNRRDFIKLAGLVGASVHLGLPCFSEAIQKRAKRLVVIHLFGGNDGLNTIVPCGDANYRRLRPNLALTKEHCLSAGMGLYFNPALKPLMPLWEKGLLSVVNGVGYPNTNHSHFLSSDIWNGGGFGQEFGWLGRAADHGRLQTVQLAGIDQARCLLARDTSPLCLDPERTDPIELDPHLALLYGKSPALAKPYRDLEKLNAGLKQHRCEGETHGSVPLSMSLKWIAELMPEARIFHTTAGGFDTHSEQLDRHHEGLHLVAQSLVDFWSALEKRGWAESTLVMVFSEFGRRVEENQSGGTDHGTAGPVFMLGKGLKGGFLGQYPSLAPSALLDGDLKHNVDFRAIYSGILEHWLEVPAEPILGRSQEYDRLRWWV